MPLVELIHYSNDTILLSKSYRTYRGNMYSGEKDQILLMNRGTNKLVAVKRLYFKDKNTPLNKKSIYLFPDNLFAIVLKPEELVQMLNEQQIKQSIMNIMIPKTLAGSEAISDFDNPYILIGRFQ